MVGSTNFISEKVEFVNTLLHTSNFTFDIDVPVRGYTMRMPVASPCACAWQCHGHVRGVAMGMCMA